VGGGGRPKLLSGGRKRRGSWGGPEKGVQSRSGSASAPGEKIKKKKKKKKKKKNKKKKKTKKKKKKKRKKKKKKKKKLFTISLKEIRCLHIKKHDNSYVNFNIRNT